MANYIDSNGVGSLALSITGLAARYVQEYLQTPMINGIFIFPYEYVEILPSDVSGQMIIDSSGGRIAFSDNIALNPTQWQIKAYLKGSLIELTSFFMPSLQLQVFALMFQSCRLNRL